MLNTLNEYLTDLWGVIYLVSAQDRKTNAENTRLIRMLRHRYRGVYSFLVPQIPNENGIFEFRIDCSHCSYKLAVDMNMVGAMGECPICKHSLTIPDSLDYLAHSLQLPDDVPIAQIQPVELEQCRDLLLIVTDCILTACDPPVPAAGPVTQPEPHSLQGTQVRERDSKAGKKIVAVEVKEEIQDDVLDEDQTSEQILAEDDTLSEELTTGEYTDVYNEIDQSSLDEILNSDEDQFDIDEFIKSVHRK